MHSGPGQSRRALTVIPLTTHVTVVSQDQVDVLCIALYWLVTGWLVIITGGVIAKRH